MASAERYTQHAKREVSADDKYVDSADVFLLKKKSLTVSMLHLTTNHGQTVVDDIYQMTNISQ